MGGFLYEVGGYSQSTETISILFKQAAELWMDEYGHDDYWAGRTSAMVPFLRAAEIEYFPIHKRRFPNNWGEPNRPDYSERQSVLGLLKCDEIPEHGEGALYRHLGEDGSILYIGKTNNFLTRQKYHRKNAHWWNDIVEIDWMIYPDPESLGAAEIEEIKSQHPSHNIVHNRGNK